MNPVGKAFVRVYSRAADLTELKQQIQPILGSVDQVKAVYRVTTMEPYSTLQFKESFPTF
ncbi:UNVERIFIED_CONTAM: hypothetical protein Slati_4572200 [Sesamum latifolium]|uniref:Uncharacterized protein n=1 Tax=Sesamum latifolium TaxID=2727402 RepID=A0AAW2SFY5_9LAMI